MKLTKRVAMLAALTVVFALAAGPVLARQPVHADSLPEQGRSEIWEPEEFSAWMGEQREAYQRLVDEGTVMRYVETPDGKGSYRKWTQEDVDALYAQWEETLRQMRQGYRITKSIVTPDGGALVGAFGPEAPPQGGSTQPSTAHTPMEAPHRPGYTEWMAETYLEYEPYGLLYDRLEDCLYYHGERIRSFYDLFDWDGVSYMEDGETPMGECRTFEKEDGSVDVLVERDYENGGVILELTHTPVSP